jgi:L,D-peptidoglycan transpeptidase YkuD (ErfK/YbiS/YcfS/YnhG family)
MSRALTCVASAAALITVAVTAAGIRDAEAQAVPPAPVAWFTNQAGSAHQVISVVGTGGTDAWLLAWEKRGATWVAIGRGTAAKVGPVGISASFGESSSATPAGVFALSTSFGRKANPGSGLPYRRVDTSDWWVSDSKSTRYNTYYRCAPGHCPFRESAGENLGRAGQPYDYAAVMGVNPQRKPYAGSAFFLHASNGKPTAGCVAVPSVNVASLLRWLRPGALIAIRPR